MAGDTPVRHAPTTRSPEGQADAMRLFKRKTPSDDAIQCPDCGERVPEGTHECAMCGHDLGHDAPQTATELRHASDTSR